jgi:hypothetical protein
MNRPTAVDKPASKLGIRLVWFAVIWLGSVAGLGVVAMVIRWAIKP